jgi:hypothetical protein
MTRIALALALAALVTLPGCGGKKEEGAGGAKATEGGGQAAAAKPGKTITINEADWVEKNLKEVSPMINISMKVPKDAKLEKNGNGGVDVTVNDLYQLTVSQLAVSNVAEAMESDKSLSIGHSSYINGKVVTDEPTGMVYTMQMKDEENGIKYQPEFHFAHYLEKDGAIYSIQDAKPLSSPLDTPGSTYSEALAKQVYGLVKASAKVN